MAKHEKPEPRTVEIPEQSYQPSVAELNEDIRVGETFDDAVRALASPVNVRPVPVPKPKDRK